MTRSSTRQQFRKLFPMAALAVGALVLAAAPVNVGPTGFGLQQVYAQGTGDNDKGGSDRGADHGGTEAAGADRGGTDTSGADRGNSGNSGTSESGTSSADPVGHETIDR